MTQYKREEIVGRNCRFLQGPLSDRETIKKISKAVKGGKHIGTCIVNYKKDGKLKIILYYYSLALKSFSQYYINNWESTQRARLIPHSKTYYYIFYRHGILELSVSFSSP